jgi:argonaute-like protein implicated in RNA metabolism and viral defense
VDGVVRCQIRNFRDYTQAEASADSVILEARPEIIQEVLQRIGKPFEVIRLQREMSFLSSSKASADRYAKTVEFVHGLLRGRTPVFPIREGALVVELARTPLAIRGTGFPQGTTIEEPGLLFDRSDSSSTHKQAYWGLRNFGPYQKDMPEIRLAVLGRGSELARLESLAAELNKGTQSMPGGMRRFFRADLRVVHRIVVSSYELRCLESTIEEFLQSNASGGVDTVLAMLPSKTDEFRLETPYYTIKAVLAKKGITFQMLTPDCFANLKWNALNIATALFAKAGGTPWVVEKAFPDVDMIVGFALSTVISRTRRAGNNPKYIGCANVFDSNGRWMFFAGTECEHVAGNRVEQIGELFRAALVKYRAEKGVPPRRVAVHYYKRFGWGERQTIYELLRDTVPDPRLAFITIDDSHPYRAYDKSNRDGDFARGGLVRLGDRQFLLCTSGHSQYAGRRMGTPRILNVSYREEPEVFTSPQNIAEHLLALTKLNYQTVTPLVREPVTLLFANLIANFAAAMSAEEYRSLARTYSSANFKARLWFI